MDAFLIENRMCTKCMGVPLLFSHLFSAVGHDDGLLSIDSPHQVPARARLRELRRLGSCEAKWLKL